MSHQRRISRTVTEGALAGLGGAWCMTVFTRLWNGVVGFDGGKDTTEPSYSPQERNSTERIAEIVAARLLKRQLNDREKRQASAAIHWFVGSLAGAGYAIAAERFPKVRRFSGALFGAAIWLVADEVLMPAAGLTPSIKEYSIAAQANALGEHVVFGVVSDGLLRLQQAAFRPAQEHSAQGESAKNCPRENSLREKP